MGIYEIIMFELYNDDCIKKINELAEKNNLSFNSVINQIIEYGLKNLED